MTRWSRGLLALSLLLVLAGCGSSEPVPAEGEQAVEDADQAAAEAEQPTAEAEQPPGEVGQVAVEAEQPAGEGEQATEEAGGMLQRRAVKLYFPSASADRLIAQSSEIFDTRSPVDRAKQILSDLISGPSRKNALRCVPRGTKLRQIYVLENGVAYADFSSELRAGIDGGSMRELMTVYSIVDSLVLNIPEIRRVGILVEGKAVKTLNGHVDLTRPLPANRRLLRADAGTADPEDDAPQNASASRGPRVSGA